MRTVLPTTVVIGVGAWGKNLLRNFADLGGLRGFYDPDQVVRARVAAAHPGSFPYASLDALLADADVRAVAIATPPATHGAVVARALDAGKHVFVEKPLCLDLTEARRLRNKATASGLMLMVGHLLLYHPAFIALKTAVESGRLGTLRYIYSNRLSLGKIRREENALWSFAPHDISMMLQLTGSMPVSVSASAGCYLSNSIADTTLSQLTFADGVQAHIFVSWLHPYKDQRLVVVGDKAMAAFNDTLPGREKLLLYPHKAEWDGAVPVVEAANAIPIPYDEAEPLRRECEAFLEAVVGISHPPSDAEEGIRVLQVLEACQRAIENGRRVTLSQMALVAKSVSHA